MSTKKLQSAIIADFMRVRKELGQDPSRKHYFTLRMGKFPLGAVIDGFGSWFGLLKAVGALVEIKAAPGREEKREPKVLIFDIETAPLTALTWRIRDVHLSHEMIEEERAVIAFAAKWEGKPEMIYHDQRDAKDIRDDKHLLVKLWALLNAADIVMTKNGKRFDARVVNGRMAVNKMVPPSPYEHEDIEVLFRRHFDLPSFKMDYLAKIFKCKHQKLKHTKFPGIELWRACLARAPGSWEEMEKYNRQDVLVTEELRAVVAPWGGTVDRNPFHSDLVHRCSCGSTDLVCQGTRRKRVGVYRRFQCKTCGRWSTAEGAINNAMSDAKKLSIKTPRPG